MDICTPYILQRYILVYTSFNRQINSTFSRYLPSRDQLQHNSRSHGTLVSNQIYYCHFVTLCQCKQRKTWTPRYRIRSVRSMLYKGPSTVPDCGELWGSSRSRIAALRYYHFFEFEPRSACLHKTPITPTFVVCTPPASLLFNTPSPEATAKV